MPRRSLRRPFRSPLTVQRLEDRTVPAGNISAALLFGSYLQLNGDAAANSVQLSSSAPGSVTVQGIGTTVNGSNKAITFSGIHDLFVNMAEGNDIVRGQNLAISGVSIYGGSGNDNAQLVGSRPGLARMGQVGLSVSVNGDGEFDSPNGNDTITVTGTKVQGDYATFGFQGDSNYDAADGRDLITVLNNRADVKYFDINVYGDYGLTGPGNIITIANLDVNVNADNAFIQSFIDGSSHDDTFRLMNVNINLHGEVEVYADFSVGSFEGNDTIDASNVSLLATTTQTTATLNQFFANFFAGTIRMNNVDFVGGGKFYDPDFGYYYTIGQFTVTGSEIDLKNVTVDSEGFGTLYLPNTEFYLGYERDDSWTLTNVVVTSAEGDKGELVLEAGGGNDEVQIKNSSAETLSVFLGDGNDELTLKNVVSNSPIPNFGFYGIFAGSGDDTVNLANCIFPELTIELEDDNDSLTLKNNTFVSLLADLGEGDDTATVWNNNASDSMTVHGGGGFDTLSALNNFAPSLDFDEFEV